MLGQQWDSLTIVVAILQVNIAIGILYIRFRAELVTALLYRGKLFDKIVNEFNTAGYAENIANLLTEAADDAELHRQHSYVLEWLRELPDEGLDRLYGIDNLRKKRPSESYTQQSFLLTKYHEFRRSHVTYVWTFTIIPAILSLWILLFTGPDSSYIYLSVLFALFGQCVPLWNLVRRYFVLRKVHKALSEAINYVKDRLDELNQKAEDQVESMMRNLSSKSSSDP